MYIGPRIPFVSQLINVTSRQALERCCIHWSPEQPGADLHISKQATFGGNCGVHVLAQSVVALSFQGSATSQLLSCCEPTCSGGSMPSNSCISCSSDISMTSSSSSSASTPSYKGGS